MTGAAYAWIMAGVANNGLELQYSNEGVACDSFASDDYGVHYPSLSIGYSLDSGAPSGTVAPNGTYDDGAGHLYTNDPTVSLTTTTSDPGATSVWGSNWTSVNGVGTVGYTASAWSVDTAGSQLNADTSPCGTTVCWTQTFFTNTVSNMSAWPSFTAMFKTDTVNSLHFGVISSANNNTRFDLTADSTGFTKLEASSTAGTYSSIGVTVHISANTWYYGQVDFPYPTVGEIRIWPVGQSRPTNPTVYRTGISMDHPGLNFWESGDNGANLHHYYVGNVNVVAGTYTSIGAWGMRFSNDNATWSCPAPAGGTWCVGAARQTGWTLPAGDGVKTVYMGVVDNFGILSTSSASGQIILDTAAPSAAMAAPAAGHEVRGVVTVTGTASDPGTVGVDASGTASAALYLDGTRVGTPIEGTSAPTFLWDSTNVPPGAHVLTLHASDNAGNTAISAGDSIIVSNTGQMPYETFATRDLPDSDGSHSVAVNVGNGDTVVTHEDLDVPSRGPDLALGRTYNALAPICAGLFGCGWTSDLDEGLLPNGDGSVTYRDPDGGMHVFLPNGSGGYLTAPGLYLALAKNGDGSYTLTSHDQTKTNFNSSGYLVSVRDRNGNTLSVAYDANNLPTSVSDAAGRQLTITTSGGHITAIAAPGARSLGYGYDGNGNLTSFTDPAGIVTQYAYDASHRLTSLTLNYISGGAQDQQTNVTTTLTYDSDNRLVGLVDPLGYDVGIAYTDPTALSGGQTAVSQLQLTTNGAAHPTTPTSDSAVYETTTYFLTSDGTAAVAALVDPMHQGDGLGTSFQYDGNEDVTQVTDADGRVTTSTYDAGGNELTQVADPGSGHLALTTTYTYDGSNNLLTATDPRGIVTQYTYDAPATGNLTRVVHHYVSGGPSDSKTNVTTSYTYDAHGQTSTATDPLGIVTQYAYDAQGDVTQTVENYVNGGPSDSQTNVTTSATYDDLSQRVTATNALGIATQYTYDIRGNVMQTVANYVPGQPSDNQTNVATGATYDALGRRVTSTNARGIVSKTVYDADGREVTSIANYVNGGPSDSQTNVTTTTAYDGAGNATLASDPTGNTTTTTMDLDNRATEVVVRASAAAGGAVAQDTTTTYDDAGLTLSRTVVNGGSGQTTSYTYDVAGRTATQSDPPASSTDEPNVTTTTYDAGGNVVASAVTNGGAAVSNTTSIYDALSRPTHKTEQAGTSAAQTTTYAYDAAGHQTSLTDPASHTTTSTYDALGRTLITTASDGSQQALTYDAAGERLSQSNCGGTTGQSGTAQDTYDALGRVVQEQQRDCAGVLATSVTYTYDANGNKTQEQTSYAGGTLVTLGSTYDALDRLATQTDGTRTYSYDASGNPIQQLVRYAGATAVRVNATFDGGNRLSTMSDTVGAGETLYWQGASTYDGSGNRTQVVENGVTTTYAYDGENQLTTIKDGTGLTLASYTYDAHHNRTAMTTSAGTTSYTYDQAAGVELTGRTDPDGKQTAYAYDAAGNLTTATYDPSGVNQPTTYAYDATGRLTRITQPGGTVITFAYDGNGQRVSKTVTSGTTTSVVNDVYQLGHVAYETDGNGTVLASFSYDSQGVPTSVRVGSDPATAPLYYYVDNGHGDTIALTDATGAAVARYSYDPWGVVTSDTESFANGWHNPYLYDGRDGARYDQETGLYWLAVRAYDPTIGRFLSRDPLGRVPLVGWSDQPYVYAGNNPLVNVDPSGESVIPGDGSGGTKPSSQPPISGPSWLVGFATFLVVNGAGLLQAVKDQHGVAKANALQDALEAAVKNLRYRLPLSKVWKSKVFRRGSQAIEAQEATNAVWKTFGRVLIGVGFLVDMLQYAWSYYHSSYRRDLTGTERAVVALIAGAFHGLFVTGLALLGSTVVSMLLTPIAGWAAGMLIGLGAGWLADHFIPKLIDKFIPRQAFA